MGGPPTRDATGGRSAPWIRSARSRRSLSARAPPISLMPVRAVLFDFGGTLVQSLPVPFDAFAPVFENLGLEISVDRWIEADRRVWPRVSSSQYTSLGKTPSFWDRVHAETLKELGVPDERGEVVRALRDAATSPEWHRPFPETEGVLDHLRTEGIPLHVVSNNTDYLIESLSRLGWNDLFQSVTFSQEVGAEKPDRRVFEWALRRAKCRSREALFVGDSWEADYLGAVDAGLVGVWLNRREIVPPEPCSWISQLGGVLGLVSDGP